MAASDFRGRRDASVLFTGTTQSTTSTRSSFNGKLVIHHPRGGDHLMTLPLPPPPPHRPHNVNHRQQPRLPDKPSLLAASTLPRNFGQQPAAGHRKNNDHHRLSQPRKQPPQPPLRSALKTSTSIPQNGDGRGVNGLDRGGQPGGGGGHGIMLPSPPEIPASFALSALVRTFRNCDVVIQAEMIILVDGGHNAA